MIVYYCLVTYFARKLHNHFFCKIGLVSSQGKERQRKEKLKKSNKKIKNKKKKNIVLKILSKIFIYHLKLGNKHIQTRLEVECKMQLYRTLSSNLWICLSYLWKGNFCTSFVLWNYLQWISQFFLFTSIVNLTDWTGFFEVLNHSILTDTCFLFDGYAYFLYFIFFSRLL